MHEKLGRRTRRSILRKSGGRRELSIRRGLDFESAKVISTDHADLVLFLSREQSSWSIHGDRPARLFRFNTDDLAYELIDCFEPGDLGMFAISLRENGSNNTWKARLMQAKNLFSNVEFFGGGGCGANVFELLHAPAEILFCTIRVADPLPHLEHVSEYWHQFLRIPSPRLSPFGGLRFGQTNRWISGAGPLVRIEGQRLPSQLLIDGSPYAVSDRIFRCSELSKPGLHTVKAKIDECDVLCEIPVDVPEWSLDISEPDHAWAFESGWPHWQSRNVDLAGSSPWLMGLNAIGFENVPASHRGDAQREAIRFLTGWPPKVGRFNENEPTHPMIRWLHCRRRRKHNVFDNKPSEGGALKREQ